MARLTSLVCAVSVAAALAGPAGSSAHEVFEVALIPCNETLCGTASEAVAREGKVEVGEGGEVKVVLRHGPVEAGLCLEFQPWGSAQRALVGDFRTDQEGDAQRQVGVLDVRGEMGIFLVTDCAGSGLLVTGIVTHPERSGDDDDDDGGVEDDDGGGDGGEIGQPDDPDDDGLPNDQDPDDDGDGISDADDANPQHANRFDDVRDATDLQNAYRQEQRTLKEDHSLALRALKEQQREEKNGLVDEYRERKQALR